MECLFIQALCFFLLILANERLQRVGFGRMLMGRAGSGLTGWVGN